MCVCVCVCVCNDVPNVRYKTYNFKEFVSVLERTWDLQVKSYTNTLLTTNNFNNIITKINVRNKEKSVWK
jgi:hypothetical protein